MKNRAVWALGAMSGTSLDGVDAAMLLTDGVEIFEFGPTAYRAFSQAEQRVIRDALGKWPGEAGVNAAAEMVEGAHLDLLSRFEGAEIVGFHGQTLAHEPGGRGTHQVGNGAVLAEVLGVPVVWDFRTNDVALGGQGAPLAPFFHFACAKWIGATEPLAILNLGGVGNLTWIDPSRTLPQEAGALLAFDTGPANAPINDLMQRHFGQDHDEAGALAATGSVDEAAVQRFLDHPFFYKIPPKSLDRNDFASTFRTFATESPANAAATLTRCCVEAVVRGAEHFPKPVTQMLVTGGGRHNATMMAGLAQRLLCPIRPVEAVGLNGDMLEAQAFAYLAQRVVCGLPTSCPSTTGVGAAVGGGKVSKP